MRNERPFIDTNVFLRHLMQDHPDHSSRATRLLERLDDGSLEAETSEAVVAEVVFTLERGYRVPRSELYRVVRFVMGTPALLIPGKQTVLEALDIYASRAISFIDASTIVSTRRRGITTIVSFDRDFDRVPGIRRVEPDAEGALPG